MKSVAPKVVVTKVDIEESIYPKINKCIDDLITDCIERGYKTITEEILNKAKKSAYEELGASRKISGAVAVFYGNQSKHHKAEEFWPAPDAYPENLNAIVLKYLQRFPDFSAEYNDTLYNYSIYVFECKLINRIKHSAFVAGIYHSYHCTDTAKKIIAGIREKAAIDGIWVEFSHMELDRQHIWVDKDNKKITDGGNDRGCSNSASGYTATMMLKYSVTF